MPIKKSLSRRQFLQAGLAAGGGAALLARQRARAQTAPPPYSVYLPTIASPNPFALASSLTQFGITWIFDKAYPTGQFANGDYWVVGPLKIIAISPASTVVAAQNNRVINGSMLDPAINLLQGYDSQMLGTEGRAWDPGLNVARPGGNDLSAQNPLVINAPASLASSVSQTEPGSALNVRRMAVLTILDAVPPRQAFRPPFVGSNNKAITHTLADIHSELLPNLTVPAGIGVTVAEVAADFEKPWVEHMQDWQKELFCPPENMPAYGREIAIAVSQGALMLTLNVDQTTKTQLMLRLIQLGLDYYGMVQAPNGHITWTADGGHMSGRVFPILLAGHLLGDQNLLGMMQKSGQYAYQNGYAEGNLPPDYIHFGEIDQTFYVTQRDVDRTHSAGWSPDPRGNTPEPYETSDIGLAEWGITHVHAPLGDNRAWAATYRQVNSSAWSGMILASRILGLTSYWNHPPLFAYVNRWMELSNNDTGGNFQLNMWTTYHSAYP